MGDTQALPRLCNGSVLTPIIFGERWLDFSVEQWTMRGLDDGNLAQSSSPLNQMNIGKRREAECVGG